MPKYIKIILAILYTFLGFLLIFYFAPLFQWEEYSDTLFLVPFSGFSILLTILLDIYYFERRIPKPPVLFRYLIFFLIWSSAIFAWFMNTNKDLELFNSILTTSGVIIAVIGFAIRNLVSDFFSGITIGMEAPFTIGEWIELSSGESGQVVEMNWRSTKLVTLENIMISIPNSILGTLSIRNYNRPNHFFRVQIEITLDYDVPRQKAERILLGSANEVKSLRNRYRDPDLRIKEFSDRGVVWILRFWVDEFAKKSGIIYEVQKNILRNLRLANTVVPPKKFNISRSQNQRSLEKEIKSLLTGLEIFEDLETREIDYLVEHSRKHFFSAKETIVSQGDTGSSLYLVAEGLLGVNILHENGKEIEVASLSSGNFFGEMSLLTGAERSASVYAIIDSIVYEIPKSALEPFLENDRKLLNKISDTLAKRKLQNLDQSQFQSESIEQVSKTYLSRIVKFFNLKQ